jgi:hypothetical protein
MQLPVVLGVIDRRLLVNYRACPEVVQQLLPRPFEPQIVAGHAIVGLCLIRLRQVRPVGLPFWVGIASENAAHRIAVQWRSGGQWKTGVYVFRRDTNSRLNALAGGRIFPGIHHRSSFVVQESADRMRVGFTSGEGAVSAWIDGQVSTAWPVDSVFPSLADESEFFEQAPLGYSPGVGGRLQGLELRCRTWQAEPLALNEVRSSFFDDESRFPAGTIALDSGLIMRGIEHEWHAQPDMAAIVDRDDATASALFA